MQLQILIQTLLLPFFISAIAYKYLSEKYSVFVILIAWLVAFFWVQGLPGISESPVDQVWVYLCVAVVARLFFQLKQQQVLLTTVYIFSLLFSSLPIFKYEVSLSFLIELAVFVVAGLLMIWVKTNNNKPASTLVFSLLFSGLLIALTASISIASMGISLAAALGVYAVIEIKSRFKEQPLNVQYLPLFGFMYLLILFVARVYAELDITITLLLIVVMLWAFFSSKKTNLMMSGVFYPAAIVFILVNDSVSLYS